ncbi:MAG: alkaline phosphatase D family protein [Pirellulaceae bacterium]|nr:alkaline phosphatase D family protein [Pirellulaceae bacterium]
MNRIHGVWPTILALAITTTNAFAQDSPLFSGPMIGHTTESSSSVWMYAPKDSTLELTFAEAAASNKKTAAIFSAVPNPAGNLAGVPYTVTLKKLKPLTKYDYQVKVDGKSDAAYQGSFQTAPATAKGSKFRVAVTSCMKFGEPQDSWDLLLAENPDLHVTLGDTHYSDTTDPTKQWKHHLRYRAVPQFAAVLRSTPNYAMWDDHDYGPNNSDGTALGKENSLLGWNQVWANPNTGTDETPGAFFKFSWGEVDFFMLDGRYHRSPDDAPDDDKKRMLGDAQFAWLIEGLKNSHAKFKVIASGSTLADSKNDGWRIYTFSRHRLFDAIAEHNISGVLYMSGDIHRSRVWTHPESDRVGYPLIEVISSGVANSATLSYATVDFDTTADDPSVQVRIVHGDGEIHADKTWKLSDLTPQK